MRAAETNFCLGRVSVRLAVNGKAEVEFYGRMGGGIPSEEEVLSRIEAMV